MTGYVAYIEGHTEDKNDFRRVLETGPHMKMVLMMLLPGEQIGEEMRGLTDKFRGEEDAGARSSSTGTSYETRC